MAILNQLFYKQRIFGASSGRVARHGRALAHQGTRPAVTLAEHVLIINVEYPSCEGGCDNSAIGRDDR